MYLPENYAHIVLSSLWIAALATLYIISLSPIAATALLLTAVVGTISWPRVSQTDFVSHWISEYKFYKFAMEAKALSALKTEKKLRNMSH